MYDNLCISYNIYDTYTRVTHAPRGPSATLPRGLGATSHPPVVPRATLPPRHITTSPRQLTGPVDQNTPPLFVI